MDLALGIYWVLLGTLSSYHTATRRKIHQCPVCGTTICFKRGKADRNVCPTGDLLGWNVPWLTSSLKCPRITPRPSLCAAGSILGKTPAVPVWDGREP